jgi:hypothetical protein
MEISCYSLPIQIPEEPKEKRGCNWGRCEHCAVIPLLYKLGKGELHESAEAVASLKEEVFRLRISL